MAATWFDNIVTWIAAPDIMLRGAEQQEQADAMMTRIREKLKDPNLSTEQRISYERILQNLDYNYQSNIAQGNADVATAAAIEGAGDYANFIGTVGGTVTGGVLSSFFSRVPWWVWLLVALGLFIYFAPVVKKLALKTA